MKNFKISLILLGLVCVFTLYECIGENSIGNSNSSNLNTVSVNNVTKLSHNEKLSSPMPKTIANTLHSALNSANSMLSSVTLWQKQNDPTTAIAGEIIDDEQKINIQVPADMANSENMFDFFLTFTGADKIIVYGVGVPNNTKLSLIPKFPIKFTVIKGGISKDYTVSFTPRDPYFTFYDTATKCVKDIDGNIWVKLPNRVYSDGQWESTLHYINNSFSVCGILTPNWGLPSSIQMTTMINLVPLAFRSQSPSPDTIPAAWFNSLTENKVKLFNLPPLVDFWSSESDPYNSSNALAMRLNAADPKIVSNSKRDYYAVGWPVSRGDGSSAKTITDFTFAPESGSPSKCVIIGNQIFIKATVYPNAQGLFKLKANFSITGGVVTINGVQYKNGDIFTFFEPVNNISTQIIPVTVTASNKSTNIYTLVLQFVRPSMNVFACTSANSNASFESPHSNTIFAVVANKIYKNTLPAPGSCQQIKLDDIALKNLSAGHPVLWFSVSSLKPIALTWYDGMHNYQIPKFLVIPNNNDLSGYSFNVTMDPACYLTSPTEFSSNCTN